MCVNVRRTFSDESFFGLEGAIRTVKVCFKYSMSVYEPFTPLRIK